MGLNSSVPATCYPTATTIVNFWGPVLPQFFPKLLCHHGCQPVDFPTQVRVPAGHVVLAHTTQVYHPNILFLNKNWAQQAIDTGAVSGISAADLKDGLDLTFAQLEALLTYFKDNDMNGNGDSADERPILSCFKLGREARDRVSGLYT